MRDWLVGGAVIERGEAVLMVQNLRRNGDLDWSTPGGVIDDTDSTLLDGLAREVLEETGLTVSSWTGPLYEVVTEAPGLGWRLRVEVHRAEAWSGDVLVDDPDGIVVDAEFMDAERLRDCLAGHHTWVAEPMLTWFDERWDGSRTFRYRLDGERRDELVVHRV